MSNNTNTLFWVITGAVIVLAVFLLVNTSQENTLTGISNKFNSFWTNENNNSGPNEEPEPYVEPEPQIEYSDYYLRNSNRFTCKANGLKVEKDGFIVEIRRFSQSSTTRNIAFTWTQTNNTGISQKNINFNLYIYKCGDNTLIKQIDFKLESLNINEKHEVQHLFTGPNYEYEYYIDFDYNYY